MVEQIVAQAESIYKTFPGAKEAVVKNISFTLEKGKVLVLLGPNGAGKTTTVKILLGLTAPTAGSISILGYNMVSPSEMRSANNRVGAVLEGARNTYWVLSAIENLRYFGGLRGMSRKEIDGRADELLTVLGLRDYRNEPVKKYSRGMQQKVALACALIHDPDVLVLDEPTLGLDVEAAIQLEATMAELVRRGKSILLTTHVMSLAERMADKILVMNRGVTVAHDTAENLLRQFDTRKVVEITVDGQMLNGLQTNIENQFPSIVIDHQKQGTKLTWVEPEQRQVINLLDMADKTGYQVTSVVRREPTLEEVFLSLTARKP